MKSTLASAFLFTASFAVVAGCNRGASSGSSASTTPGSQIQPSPSPSPSAQPNPSPSPSPTPIPPGTSGGWLHVTSAAAPATGTGGTIDTITTFAIDPVSGGLASPVDTTLPANFGLSGIAADPAASLLFATGGGDTLAQVRPGQVLPIQVTQGVLTLGTVFDMGSASMGNVVPATPVAANGFLFASSLLTTTPSGPVTGGPIVSFSYDPQGVLTLVQPASPPAFTPPANGSPMNLAVDSTASFVFGSLMWGATTGEIGAYANAAGVTTPVAGSPFSIGSATAHASFAVVHPSGQWVFTGNDDGSLTTFTNTAGVLSNPVSTSPSNGFSGPIAIESSGTYLYQVMGTMIVAFAIDPATGALTMTGTPTIPPLTGLSTILADANGHIYAAVYDTGNAGTGGAVQAYSIGAAGTLAAVGSPAALPSGNVPQALAFTP